MGSYPNLVGGADRMIRVIVPTLNAARYWPSFAPALLSCVQPNQVLVIDSSSTDGTAELAREAGFEVINIRRADFNHGATRQMAAELLSDADVLVFLTQDAVLTDRQSIQRMVEAFDDPTVGMAYGRQLPRKAAGAIEAHARLFNYPAATEVRDLSSRERLGFKAAFVSNSYSAYRRAALMAIGGFRAGVILSEDTLAAATLLLAGWKIAYTADACVYHSHCYTWLEEFKRYFDIGVLHSREPWLLSRFGHAGGDGKRFVFSELNFLREKAPWLIPSALIRTGLKLIAYRLGRSEDRLAPELKRHLSMHHLFWSKHA
jgi:rhamnosyltransferase